MLQSVARFCTQVTNCLRAQIFLYTYIRKGPSLLSNIHATWDGVSPKSESLNHVANKTKAWESDKVLLGQPRTSCEMSFLKKLSLFFKAFLDADQRHKAADCFTKLRPINSLSGSPQPMHVCLWSGNEVYKFFEIILDGCVQNYAV